MASKIDELMERHYRMVIDTDPYEGGYVVSFPDLPGCLTCTDDFSEIEALAADAKRAWFEAQLEDGNEIPLPAPIDDYSGQFKLRIPKSLHKSLSEHARYEGISMNQYCLYLLAKNDAIAAAEARALKRVS